MIRINPLFFIVLAVVYAVNLLPQFITVLIIAVLHEGAHAVCAYFLGQRGIVFCIQPWGVCMKCKSELSSSKEIAVASAGPFSNLIMIVISSIFVMQKFYIANLFMLIINLLPVYPLDGGRILNGVLKNEFCTETRGCILKTVSAAVTIAVFVSGCFLLYKTGVNFSVLLASLFLCMTSDQIDDSENLEPLKKVVHYMVSCDENVMSALENCRKKQKAVFDIIDVSGRYIGSVTYKQVLEQIAEYGYEIKFDEILEKHLLY